MPLYFVAILVPEKIAGDVLGWKHFMEKHFGCRQALKSPAHITLIPPVNLDQPRGVQLKKWLSDFASGRASFLVDIRNFGCFAPKVVFAAVTPSESLSAIRKDLEDLLVTPGIFPIKRDERSFHPHITLASRDLARKDFGSAWAHFQHLDYEASFRAENISLLKHNGKYWEVDFTTPFRPSAG